MKRPKPQRFQPALSPITRLRYERRTDQLPAVPFLTKLSIVSFQKIKIPSIFISFFCIVWLKRFKEFLGNSSRPYPFKNSKVPRMFTFFTSINQPHINTLSIGVYPEFARINKFLFLPATSTTMKNSYNFVLRIAHRFFLRQVFYSV